MGQNQHPGGDKSGMGQAGQQKDQHRDERQQQQGGGAGQQQGGKHESGRPDDAERKREHQGDQPRHPDQRR